MGLAVGDGASGVVTPLAVIGYAGVAAAARTIAETAGRLAAEAVVIGLPTGADGAAAPAARRSHLLAEAVAALGLQVFLQSERLSTDEARRRARESGRRRQEAVDDLAAQVVLEEYLDDVRRRAPRGA
jgi:putative transcription antitermination factor YqgF